MTLRLIFEVDIDESGVAQYYAAYPNFVEQGEEPIDTLAREAVAQWDMEGLIKEARFVTAEPVLEVQP